MINTVYLISGIILSTGILFGLAKSSDLSCLFLCELGIPSLSQAFVTTHQMPTQFPQNLEFY